MKPFSIITEFGRPIAALVPQKLTPAQRDHLYALLPSTAELDVDLSRRWEQWAVLCTPEWGSAQKRRIPMTLPKSALQLCFL